jgi:uncharacterized membrane protein (DUF106 family)
MAKSLSQIMKRSGDFTKFSNQILYNRFVLYFIFILAVGNLFHFVFSKDMMSVGAFIAAGLLTSFFSKNMVVIMVIAMVVSNVIRLSNGRDGFTGKKAKWQEAMDEMFENAMNEAFEEDDEDEDDYEDEDMEEEIDEEYEEEDEDTFMTLSQSRKYIDTNEGRKEHKHKEHKHKHKGGANRHAHTTEIKK